MSSNQVSEVSTILIQKILKMKSILNFLGPLFGIAFLIKKFLVPFIAQRLLNRAILRLISAAIVKPGESAFKLLLKVEMKESGPLKTCIKYTKPLSLLRNVSTPDHDLDQEREIGKVTIKKDTLVPAWGGLVDMASTVWVNYDQIEEFGQFGKDLVAKKVKSTSFTRLY